MKSFKLPSTKDLKRTKRLKFSMLEKNFQGFQRILKLVSEAAGVDFTSRTDKGTLQDYFLLGGSLVDWVLDTAELTEREFGEALAGRMGLDWNSHPEVDESNADVLRSLLAPPIALKHRALPLKVDFDEHSNRPNLLHLAHYDPLQSLDRQMARRACPCPVRWVLVPRRSILTGLQKLYGIGGEIFEDLLAARSWKEEEYDFKEQVNVIDDD